MFVGVVLIDGVPQASPSREILSAGKPLGCASTSNERQVSVAYRSRSSLSFALRLLGLTAVEPEAVVWHNPASSTDAREKTHNALKPMRFMAQPPDTGLLKGFGAESLTDRLDPRSEVILLLV
jgi:hypothetical protein